MLPGLMPVPAILAIGVPGGGGTGTPIGLLLTLTKEIPTGFVGTPIGILLTITKEIPSGGSGGGGSTAGEGAGLLLALTKAT